MDDLQEAYGGKRKYKENPLAAKAENGSLKIKIVRKNEGLQSSGLIGTGLGGALEGYALAGVPRSPSKAAAPPQPLPSPPKPRANRKHVPIFYQRPNAFDISTSTSTDENVSQTQSSVTSDYEPTYSASGTSTSSTTGRFARLDIAPGLPGSAQDPMPPMNPLFTRGMSETSGSLTDLLKTVLPSVPPLESTSSYSEYASEPLTTSQSSLLNPAAALRQLASSSAAYASQPREPTLLPSMHLHQTLQRYQSHDRDDYENGYHKEHHRQQSVTSESDEQQQQEEEEEQPSEYHFDAMSALQNAVKIAVASSSPTTTHPSSHGRWSNDHDDNDLGPPPSGPPGFSIEHSLMGGGIEAQPGIPTINTVNFNWNRYHQDHPIRPRSSSIPTTTPEKETTDSTTSSKSRAPVL